MDRGPPNPRSRWRKDRPGPSKILRMYPGGDRSLFENLEIAPDLRGVWIATIQDMPAPALQRLLGGVLLLMMGAACQGAADDVSADEAAVTSSACLASIEDVSGERRDAAAIVKNDDAVAKML